jgi:hypothetical protein
MPSLPLLRLLGNHNNVQPQQVTQQVDILHRQSTLAVHESALRRFGDPEGLRNGVTAHPRVFWDRFRDFITQFHLSHAEATVITSTNRKHTADIPDQ